jgi:hypothetical protein
MAQGVAQGGQGADLPVQGVGPVVQIGPRQMRRTAAVKHSRHFSQ